MLNKVARLQHHLTCGMISKGMSEKIVLSGLYYQHLQQAYERNGGGENYALFSEKCNGNEHITKS